LKICILAVLHEADDKRVFHKVAQSLVAAGHEVVYICPGAADLPVEKGGVRFIFMPPGTSKKQRLRSVLRLRRLGALERADVYFAVEPESWVAALWIKLRTGAKVVFDMHEHVPTEFAKFFPYGTQGFMAWLTVRFMRLFARFTNLVILTRDSFEREWAGLRVPRTTVINTNHLQPRCQTIPEAIRTRYADCPTIIHQGVFGDVRGSWQLLDAMKLLVRTLPNLRCIILGSYLYGSEAEYREAIRTAGLEDHIDMPGLVPYAEVPAYIAVAKVGLILFQPGLVNHTLAMPHKLFDYMREQVPVVAPDFALEVRHIMQEADCGLLVDVTRPEAIADAIRRLLQDPALAQRLGENGRRIVETKYNWAHDEKKLLDAIAALQ
jgi:glycosyltransferase involved in cell wall biosynthesis